ncbi:MAG: hypothetical protein LBO80_02265 [Treponema sp.]|jgi:hypothetical protein|nr:hypothetical protein [Treponema sp.]
MGRKSFEDPPQAVVKDGVVEISGVLSSPHEVEENKTLKRRIYRRTITDFVFDEDYGEFFSGIAPPDPSELIFEGPLPQRHLRWAAYTDRDVEIGSYYVYWIGDEDSEKNGEVYGPMAVKVRDPEIYWTYKKTVERMEAIKAAYPGMAEMRQFGQSTRKRPLYGIVAGNPSKLLAFTGYVHAGESGTEILLPALERLLAVNRDLLSRAGIAMLPCVNADSREKFVTGHPSYIRVNPNHVDLNRNYPVFWDLPGYGYGLDTNAEWSVTYRGPYPASEDETQAVMNFIKTLKPRGVFSFHAMGSICADAFCVPSAAATDRAYCQKCLELYMPYSKGFREINSEADVRLPPNKPAQYLTEWIYQEFKIPAADLEFNGKDYEKYGYTKRDRTDRKTLDLFRERHYQGMVNALEVLAQQP